MQADGKLNHNKTKQRLSQGRQNMGVTGLQGRIQVLFEPCSYGNENCLEKLCSQEFQIKCETAVIRRFENQGFKIKIRITLNLEISKIK